MEAEIEQLAATVADAPSESHTVALLDKWSEQRKYRGRVRVVGAHQNSDPQHTRPSTVSWQAMDFHSRSLQPPCRFSPRRMQLGRPFELRNQSR